MSGDKKLIDLSEREMSVVNAAVVEATVDWAAIEALQGTVLGVPVSAPDDLAEALYTAVRDAFPINQVPAQVLSQLREVKTRVQGVQFFIRELAKVVQEQQKAMGLDSQGRPQQPEKPKTAEELQQEEWARQSAHRPASRNEFKGRESR